MKTETLKIVATFTEPTLATSPGNPELLEEFKNPRDDAKLAEEIAAVTPEEAEERVERASTVFPKDAQGIFLWDYQLRGFFKEKLYSLIELGQCDLSKWNYKKAVDLFLFVNPRRIRYWRAGVPILKPDGDLQRPLRAVTMQGDRVALARSEMVEAGAQFKAEIVLLRPEKALKKSSAQALTMADVRACLDMGKLVGFSQWRGGGFGRFEWQEGE